LNPSVLGLTTCQTRVVLNSAMVESKCIEFNNLSDSCCLKFSTWLTPSIWELDLIKWWVHSVGAWTQNQGVIRPHNHIVIQGHTSTLNIIILDTSVIIITSNTKNSHTFFFIFVFFFSFLLSYFFFYNYTFLLSLKVMIKGMWFSL